METTEVFFCLSDAQVIGNPLNPITDNAIILFTWSNRQSPKSLWNLILGDFIIWLMTLHKKVSTFLTFLSSIEFNLVSTIRIIKYTLYFCDSFPYFCCTSNIKKIFIKIPLDMPNFVKRIFFPHLLLFSSLFYKSIFQFHKWFMIKLSLFSYSYSVENA